MATKTGCSMQRTRMKLSVAGLLVSFSIASSPARATDVVLPTEYDQDRFFVVPVVAGGEAMRLLTDTGGGVFFFDDAAVRAKLTVSGVTLEDYKGLAAKFPEFEPGKGVPTPKTEGDVIPIAPGPVRARLSWLSKDIDGILGQGWFGDRMWTLDYPGRKLTYHEDKKANPSQHANKLEMAFRKKDNGERATNYPRIQATIAGQTLEMLLATGSSVRLTADALKAVDEGGAAIRSTCLISKSVLEQWKKEHPDWRVVPNAEEATGEPMILVPELTLAGFKVDQVWFTQRPDDNFTEHFAKWMDKPVVGAIGGNALKDFRVILDYPGSMAWLEKP